MTSPSSPHPFPIRQEEERLIAQAKENNKVIINNTFLCELGISKHFMAMN